MTLPKQNIKGLLASLSCDSFRAPTEWSAIFEFGISVLVVHTKGSLLDAGILILTPENDICRRTEEEMQRTVKL